MARIGILGGTFNPPHNGHVALAQAALAGLDLDVLVVVPAKSPPHKEVIDDPGPETRFALCEAAFGGLEGVAVSRVELDRAGPSWTVDTIAELGREYPSSELLLILGADAALSLPGWKDPEGIVDAATVAWVPRADGVSNGNVGEVVMSLGSKQAALALEMEPIQVSSTLVREKAARGEDVSDLVPFAVASMISAQGLYHRKSH